MAKDQTPPEPVKTGRGLDPELQAMAKIDRILCDLGTSAQYRVLEWLKGRFASRHGTIPLETDMQT